MYNKARVPLIAEPQSPATHRARRGCRTRHCVRRREHAEPGLASELA
jgi:hypothetical protein